MLRLLILFLFCLFPLLTQAAETRGLRVVAKDQASGRTGEVQLYNRSYAVIIGIDRYKNLSPDRQLKNAVKDAKGIEQVLRNQYRFDRIYTLHDSQASRDGIMRLLTSELPGMIGEDDALFIFWAGHGNQIKTHDGELGYLIPYDGNSSGLYGNISMSQLKDDISRAIPAKHIFYAFDACYSGLLTTRSVDRAPRRDLAYLQEITRERVRQVLTAGSKGQEALDGGPRGHSVFTGRLIEILEATGDYITANEIQAILKERVYHDARARGHEQTPGFGSLSGMGDFVFVPNIQQKVQDNKAELARLEVELKQLEAREADAKRKQSEQQLRDAELARKAGEERVKAEQLRQRRLVEEQQRIEAEAKERKRLQSLKLEDEKRLATLKADLEKRKQNLQLSGTSASIESAIAEIKKLHVRIQEIESTIEREIAPTRQQVLQRYNQKIADLDQQQQSEFETRQEYADRIQKQKNDLQVLRDKELSGLDTRSLAEQQTAPLKEQILKLAEQEYSIPSEQLLAQLGKYDAEKQSFSVQVATRQGKGVQLASVGMVKIPKKEAPDFKKLFEAGLIRFEMSSKISKDSIPIVISTVLHDPGGAQYELPFIDPVTGMEFSYVKGGCFKMGNMQVAEDEKPVHEVCVDDFFMGRTEVTQGQWKKIIGTNPSHFKSCGDNCPVENVSWDDAQSFLAKLNVINGRTELQSKNASWGRLSGRIYRLPTEAEWEYAARIDNEYWYVYSNFEEIENFEKEIELLRQGKVECEKLDNNGIKIKSTCNSEMPDEVLKGMIRDNADDLRLMIQYVVEAASGKVHLKNYIYPLCKEYSGGKTHEISFGRLGNMFGLLDMLGNVNEWVNDCYQSNAYQNAKQSSSAGPFCEVNRRVYRGGSWRTSYSYGLRFQRFFESPSYQADDLGFRVVLPIGTSSLQSKDAMTVLKERLQEKMVKYQK